MEFGKEPTPTRGTSLERTLHAALAHMGFYVEDSVQVDAYELDCYVRELHLGFEADGPTHSGHRQVKDAQRDARILEAFGIEILRVPGRLLGGSEQGLTEMLDSFINKHADTAAARRAKIQGTW